MTGEVLYRMYAKFNLDRGCGIDKWGDLDANDQACWNALAAWVVENE